MDQREIEAGSADECVKAQEGVTFSTPQVLELTTWGEDDVLENKVHLPSSFRRDLGVIKRKRAWLPLLRTPQRRSRRIIPLLRTLLDREDWVRASLFKKKSPFRGRLQELSSGPFSTSGRKIIPLLRKLLDRED